ncbi:uncharacterized protein LOC116347157 [Contarinia nasturtii]|uniref:uncharacterized protein LOC116347157 n=1 Tax=Contarinia nasturtii TaxID=265458 RepID=UPI0012D3C1CC|nr:uncharacterized protein LOC116347157 [Contarinia nasturtii]
MQEIVVVLLLFLTVQFAVSFNPALSDIYRNPPTPTSKINKEFNDVIFCPSIPGPTSEILQTFLASLKNSTKKEVNSTNVESFGSCCRSHFECNARKNFDRPNESNTPYCQCEKSFSECLDQSKNILSSVFEYAYILGTTKCIAEDYPIVDCAKFQYFFEPYAQFSRPPNENERKREHIRCLEYNVDKTKPKEFQSFDLPFIHRSGQYDVVKYLENVATNSSADTTTYTKFSAAVQKYLGQTNYKL